MATEEESIVNGAHSVKCIAPFSWKNMSEASQISRITQSKIGICLVQLSDS